MIGKPSYFVIPREDRTCPNCSLKEIEDDWYVLLCCPCHSLSRINQSIPDKMFELQGRNNMCKRVTNFCGR